MEKYLKKQRQANSVEGRDEVRQIRFKLEGNQKIEKEELSAALEKSRVRVIREIFLFQRYEEFRDIIKRCMSEDQIEADETLAELYREYQSLKRQQRGWPEQPAKPADQASQSKAQLYKKAAIVSIGLLLFLLAFYKRQRIKSFFAKLGSK